MFYKKGFTLIELLVVIVILGIFATIAVNTYTYSIKQAEVQNAANNLQIIANAQQSYYFKNGTYCYVGNPGDHCDGLNGPNSINQSLSLNLSDNSPYSRYWCTGAGSSYQCFVSFDSMNVNSLYYDAGSQILKGCFGSIPCPSGWTQH